MKHIVILFIIILFSCNKKEDPTVLLQVTNIEMSDRGRIPNEFQFDAVSKEANIVKCIIRTRNIMRNDVIQSIDALIKGKELTIYIISYPYDFDCDSCLSVHDLSFELNGLTQRKCDVNITINNVQMTPFFYEIK